MFRKSWPMIPHCKIDRHKIKWHLEDHVVFFCFLGNVVIYRNFLFLYKNNKKVVTIKHWLKEKLVSFGLISILACMCNLLGGNGGDFKGSNALSCKPIEEINSTLWTHSKAWYLLFFFFSSLGSNLLHWDFYLSTSMHSWYIFCSWSWQGSESGP